MFDKLEAIFAERALAGTKPRLLGVGYTEKDRDIIGIQTTTGVAYFHKCDLSDLIDQLMEYEEEMANEL